MLMLYIIIALFILSLLCPFIIPNKAVSNNPNDFED